MPSRNKPKTALLVAGLLAAGIASANAEPIFSYAPYANALSTYVNDDGWVDYAGLKAHRSELDTFVRELAGLDPATFAGWDRNEQFALWMNAYNALTLVAVIDHYPVKSIRDIGSVLRSVWDKLDFTVMGRTLTLNQIEHDILRKEFADARLHMAINCASIGCPPLGKVPLQAANLDAQLDTLTRRFLANPTHFRIDREKGIVHLSSIFNWFGDDFDKSFNGVVPFIANHVNETDRAYLNQGAFKLKYLDYDWNLNKQ